MIFLMHTQNLDSACASFMSFERPLDYKTLKIEFNEKRILMFRHVF